MFSRVHALLISPSFLFYFYSFSVTNKPTHIIKCFISLEPPPPRPFYLFSRFYGCRGLFSLALMLLSPQCNASFRMKPPTPTPGIHSLSLHFHFRAVLSLPSVISPKLGHQVLAFQLRNVTEKSDYFEGCNVYSLSAVRTSLTVFPK